jgi:hypothetical protein
MHGIQRCRWIVEPEIEKMDEAQRKVLVLYNIPQHRGESIFAVA